TINATLFDHFQANNVRVYSFEYPNSYKTYILGQNFLKRFNVFFDLRNNQIGFQKIDNYQRIVNPLATRFHFSHYQDSTGRTFIKELANYDGNYYKHAGLKVGDEILSVNGRAYSKYSKLEKREFHKQDKLIFEILRNDELLKIEVNV